MNDQQIMEKLQLTVDKVLGQDAIDLTDKTNFYELGINSFSLIQLICTIEEDFDIEIPNSAIKSIKNMPSAIKLIKRELSKKNK